MPMVVYKLKNTYFVMPRVYLDTSHCNKLKIYLNNPNVRFGVNCYGYKPKITTQEAEIMKNTSLYPITKEEQNFNKEVDYWTTKIKDILVAPFNSKSWSKY